MTNNVVVRIVAEMIKRDGSIGAYELGTGQLDLTGLTTSLQAMRQLPNVLRDLADQLDHGFDTGTLGD